MNETSPAITLRADIVRKVVVALIALTFLLYGGTFLIMVTAVIQGVPYLELGRVVPGELWLAAGNASGALVALLVNTKHDATPQDPAPVQVVNTPSDPVPVDPGPAPDDAPPVEDDVPEAA